MKKFVCLALLVLLGLAFAQEREALEVRYDIVTVGYNKTVAAMDAVVVYLRDLGRDTSSLSIIKENFTSLYQELMGFVSNNDTSGFGKKVAEMHKVAANFKAGTARVAEPGDMGALKKLVTNRVKEEEEKPALKQIVKRIFEKKPEIQRRICASNSEKIEKFIEKARGSGVPIVDVERVLSEVKKRCEELNVTEAEKEDATERIRIVVKNFLQTCQNMSEEEIKDEIIQFLKNRNLTINEEKASSLAEKIKAKCGREIDEEIDEVVNETISKGLSIREKLRVARVNEKLEEVKAKIAPKVREINEQAVTRAISVINQLENSGINVSEVKEKLSVVKDVRQRVASACINATSEECAKKMNEFKVEIESIGEKIKVIVRDKNVSAKVERERTTGPGPRTRAPGG